MLSQHHKQEADPTLTDRDFDKIRLFTDNPRIEMSK